MKRSVFVGAVAILLSALLATPALASNLRMDYKTGQPTYFQMWGTEFHRVETGGYDNQQSNLPCWPSHIWSYVHLNGSDAQCEWRHPTLKNREYDSWLAYITTSGTTTRAFYSTASQVIFNQYTHHGWSWLLGPDYVYDGFWLNDLHDGFNYSSSQKVDWDAIHVYFQ